MGAESDNYGNKFLLEKNSVRGVQPLDAARGRCQLQECWPGMYPAHGLQAEHPYMPRLKKIQLDILCIGNENISFEDMIGYPVKTSLGAGAVDKVKSLDSLWQACNVLFQDATDDGGRA